MRQAPPEKRREVAEQAGGGFVGGIIGTMAGVAACIVICIATEGIGLQVCGLVRGFAGAEAGRNILPDAATKVGESRLKTVGACESHAWYLKGLCYRGASGGALGL